MGKPPVLPVVVDVRMFQRQSIDQRSFGDLFRACNEELANISFLEALKRIMQLAMATLRKAYAFMV
ncbi:MAG: hypothetical protein ABIJ59_19600 [Pseudomonadota bacterium]